MSPTGKSALQLESKPREHKVAKSAGENFQRIIALGLTRHEAVGWYHYNVQSDWFIKSVLSLLLGLTLVLVSLAAGHFLQSSFTMDMILQRLMFIMLGVLFAYAAHCIASSGSLVRLSIAYESMLRKLSVMNRHGIPAFLAAALLTCYWGLPSSFDAASLSNMVHLLMCLTLISVGVLLFTGSMFVSRRVLTIVPIIAGKMLGLFGSFLILSPKYLYNVYPVVQQAETGVVMIAIMVMIDMTVLPCWLYRYFGNTAHIRQT